MLPLMFNWGYDKLHLTHVFYTTTNTDIRRKSRETIRHNFADNDYTDLTKVQLITNNRL